MYQQIDVAKTSLLVSGGSSIKEYYIPLWVYSSGVVGIADTVYHYVEKGTTNMATTLNTTSNVLHTLSSGWQSNQKFAFEASILAGSNGYATSLYLWDITTNTLWNGISTTSTTFTVVRSPAFTLTPGHEYGVAIRSSSVSATAEMSKAHLVALFT